MPEHPSVYVSSSFTTHSVTVCPCLLDDNFVLFTWVLIPHTGLLTECLSFLAFYGLITCLRLIWYEYCVDSSLAMIVSNCLQILHRSPIMLGIWVFMLHHHYLLVHFTLLRSYCSICDWLNPHNALLTCLSLYLLIDSCIDTLLHLPGVWSPALSNSSVQMSSLYSDSDYPQSCSVFKKKIQSKMKREEMKAQISFWREKKLCSLLKKMFKCSCLFMRKICFTNHII